MSSFQPRIAEDSSGQPPDVLLSVHGYPDFILGDRMNQLPMTSLADALFDEAGGPEPTEESYRGHLTR